MSLKGSEMLDIHDTNNYSDDVYCPETPPLTAPFRMEDLHQITQELINRYPDIYIELEPHSAVDSQTPDLLWLDFYRENDDSTGGSFLKLSGDSPCSIVSHGTTVFFGQTTIHGQFTGSLEATLNWIERHLGLKRPFQADEDELRLQPLEQTLSPNLLLAVQQLVRAKYYLDSMIDAGYGNFMAEGLGGGVSGSLFPSSFVREIFPFIDRFVPCGTDISALVQTSQTLGFGCKWRNINGEERDARERFVTHPKRASAIRDIDRAEYMWMKPLGLILPHEGKNRADFLREEGVEYIPARVTPYDYPIASRIQIYNIKVKGLNQCWAVLDGDLLQVIKHPSWALPVLKAYGAEVLEEWPSNFACESEVFDEIAKLARPINLRQLHSNKKYLYLSKVLGRIEAEQEDVAVSFDQIKWLRLRSKEKWWWMLPAMILSIGAFALLPNEIDIYVAEFSGAIFGGIATLCLAYVSKLFVVKRKLLQ